jgi:signal transduction histidine kinase
MGLSEPLARPLTFRYVGALLVIGGLLVTGQLLIQSALDRQQGDARVVNLAGRQRMLSQRLCMLMLAGDRARANEAADEWAAAERALVERRDSPEIEELFARIGGDHEAMLAGARAGDAAATCAHQDAFVAGMDRIVAQYEREATQRVATLRTTEAVLLGLALMVLLLEGAFVFRPAVRALRAYLAQRDRAEQQIVEVSDREQERLARDLHDGLSQHLVGISMLVDALDHDATDQQRPHLDYIGKLLGEAIEQTRGIARGLHSSALEADGLAGGLREIAVQTERMFQVACRVEVAADVVEPKPPAREHLYRIAREAVVNAAKHARAKTIEVDLAMRGSVLALTVRDDGVGIAAPAGDGLGLQIMAYRARMLGAVLAVGGGGDGGTVVTCTLPSP